MFFRLMTKAPIVTHDQLGRCIATEQLRDELFEHACSAIGRMLDQLDLPGLEALARTLKVDRPQADRN